jgi:hypothetical protein
MSGWERSTQKQSTAETVKCKGDRVGGKDEECRGDRIGETAWNRIVGGASEC